MRADDSVISQIGAKPEFGLLALFDESVPMADESAEVSDVFRGKPDARDITDPGEVGKEFGIGPIRLVGSLFQSGDIARMGGFDMPVEAMNENIGEIGDSGGGFDGDVDIGTKRSNDPMDGIGIILDGDIRKGLSLLVHDADLDGFLVVVKTDKNW